jgi:hypothetical protein
MYPRYLTTLTDDGYYSFEDVCIISYQNVRSDSLSLLLPALQLHAWLHC